MSQDLIQLMKQTARRITKAEQSEANLRMFEQLGLNIDDVELMAKAVGLEADDLLLLDTDVSISSKPRRIIGRPGRKNTTMDIADFVAVRKDLMTNNQMFAEWKRNFPNDERVKGTESLREAYRRHYGDKAGKAY